MIQSPWLKMVILCYGDDQRKYRLTNLTFTFKLIRNKKIFFLSFSNKTSNRPASVWTWVCCYESRFRIRDKIRSSDQRPQTRRPSRPTRPTRRTCRTNSISRTTEMEVRLPPCAIVFISAMSESIYLGYEREYLFRLWARVFISVGY